MNILGFGKKRRIAICSTPDDKRPVKLLKVSENVWQVVYAD